MKKTTKAGLAIGGAIGFAGTVVALLNSKKGKEKATAVIDKIKGKMTGAQAKETAEDIIISELVREVGRERTIELLQAAVDEEQQQVTMDITKNVIEIADKKTGEGK